MAVSPPPSRAPVAVVYWDRRGMHQTRTAQVVLHDDGIVIARIEQGAQQSLDDARVNLAAAIAATSGTRRPLLVDISRCLPLEPEVRHYYTGRLLVDAFSALG